jgi:Protein of unknown function (DUF2723)
MTNLPTESAPPNEATGVSLNTVPWWETTIFTLCVGAFYISSSCPTIGFGDTAILVDAIQRSIVSSHVNNHALTVLVGMFLRYLPVGEIAFRATLVSVLFGTLTAMFLYIVARQLCRSFIAALFTSVTFVILHSQWWHSTMAENYAASGFFTAYALYLWNRFAATNQPSALYGLCFIAGLSVMNHIENAFLCLAVGVTGIHAAVARRGPPLRLLTGCAVFALLGLAPWIALIFYDATSTPTGLRGAVENAFVGRFGGYFFKSSIIQAVCDVAFVLWYQSPALVLPICCITGLIFSSERRDIRYFAILGVIITLFIVFAFYPTWDKYAFLLPAFVAAQFFVALGADVLVRSATTPLRRAAFATWATIAVFAPPAFYSMVTQLGANPESIWHSRFGNGYAYNLYELPEYVANPFKRRFTMVRDFANALFTALPPNSMYLDDDARTFYPIAEYFQRYYHLRPDVKMILMNSWGFDSWGITGGELGKTLERAYVTNQNFFLPSLAHPYGPFIQEAQKNVPLEFIEFPIGDGRWIYRLRTIAETSPRYGLEEMERNHLFLPMTADLPQVQINLAAENIVFAAATSITVQSMTAFGAGWLGNDQLFLGSAGPGNSVEFALKAHEPRKVELVIRFTVGPDFGNAKVFLNNVMVGNQIGFRSGVGTADLRIGPVNLQHGFNSLIIRSLEKDERSTSFNLGIDLVEITAVLEP